jgi:ATP-dependent helicase/nuclease subunit B
MGQVFKTSSKNSFLFEVRDILLQNYQEHFSKMTVILPSGLACSTMQKMLTLELGLGILPRIIPLSAIKPGGAQLFSLMSQLDPEAISPLEEKMALAQIIAGYDDMDYDLAHALALSPSLARLFFELEAHQINLQDLKNIVQIDQAEHWYNIHAFLSLSFDKWHNQLRSVGYISSAAYQRLIFEAQSASLRDDPEEIFIIAGNFGDYKLAQDFVAQVILLPNCHMILPPFASYRGDRELDKWQIIEESLENFSSESWQNDVSYIELEDFFAECEFIAFKCQQMLHLEPDMQIAIIFDDPAYKEHYAMYLKKYGLAYRDQFGQNLVNHNVFSLLLILVKLICSEFSLPDFFALLSHPLLNDEDTQLIKNVIRKKLPFADSVLALEQLKMYLAEGAAQRLTLILEILSKPLAPDNWTNILKILLDRLENLVPQIWQLYPETIPPLKELLGARTQLFAGLSEGLFIDDLAILPSIIYNMAQDMVYFKGEADARILLTRGNSVSLVNYDCVFIPNVNEGSYPKAAAQSYWMNNAMCQELGLVTARQKLSEQLYHFLLNTQNSRVILTRAKYGIDNKKLLPSPFVARLEAISGRLLKKQSILLEHVLKLTEWQHAKSAQTPYFPAVLYATDIETLIKAPYNFYAKKILNLRKLDEIVARPSLAEFGNFFHRAVEVYHASADKHHHDKEMLLREIAQDILYQLKIPEVSKKSWALKLQAIAPEFIAFDQGRKQQASRIYSEIEGVMTMQIAGRSIDIKAIADRIEVNNEGSATIIDFKTGAVPSAREVEIGLAPQLLIEAMILHAGGFISDVRSVKELMYVKINSNKPYIKVTCIELSAQELARHYAGLEKLLMHYLHNPEFLLEPNLMKYDDYQHLARREFS